MDEGGTALAELVRRALAAHTEGQDDGDFEPYRALAARLRPAGAGALPETGRHARSRDPAVRLAAADLLGRLHNPADEDLRDELLDTLDAMLDAELTGGREPGVLAAIVGGLGELADHRTLEPLLRLRRHPDPAVRGQVALALPGAAGEAEDPRAVDALVELTGDADPSVRDYACFGLGTQMRADTPAIRDALVLRLRDPHVDTRAEAAMGLARRQDERVVPALLEALGRDTFFTLEVDAAGEIADQRLHPALTRISAWWRDDRADRNRLERALRRCDPAGRERYAELEREVLAVVTEHLDALAAEGLDAGPATLDGAFPRTDLVIPWRDTAAGTGGTHRFRLWDRQDDPERRGAWQAARQVLTALGEAVGRASREVYAGAYGDGGGRG